MKMITGQEINLYFLLSELLTDITQAHQHYYQPYTQPGLPDWDIFVSPKIIQL